MSEAKKALERKRERSKSAPDLPEPSSPDSPISASLQTSKRYPHRISLDISDEMYEYLRERAFKTRKTMVQLIRSDIENSKTHD